MNTISSQRGTAAVLLWLFMACVSAPRQPRQAPGPTTFHVRVVELTSIPNPIRVHAEDAVKKIFRQAGVSLDFMDCNAPSLPCRVPFEDHYWLEILDREPAGVNQDAAGYAILVPSPRSTDSFAVVSLSLVNAAAVEFNAYPGDVLAGAIAHELGHLLLHSSAHSRAGIMKARLDRSQVRMLERNELWFSTAEAERMTKGAR